MRLRLPLLVLLAFSRAAAADYFVSPTGADTNPGTQASPFATIMRAQQRASSGDTVYLRGGVYPLNNSHISRTDGTYAYVHDFTKPRVRYLAFPGETPVFDLSSVRPTGLRVTAFFIRTDGIHLRGFHVVGVQVTIRAGGAVANTQSENVRIRHGSGNILERLVLRDGMGVGVYIVGDSANNLVLDCDAHNNVGPDSISVGNIDGFGAHTTAAGVGNIFRGCRAWLNSDDGFDLISCDASVVIERCWAAFNGYRDTSLASGGDGNGFKAGGYGRNGNPLPLPVPRHVVRFCLAVHNRASGFYANHHAGGLDFIHNTAFRNRHNFNLLNVAADNLTNVPGYDHSLKNNLGFAPRESSVVNLDLAASDVSHNFFTLPVNVDASDFLLAPADSARLLELIATPRQQDGTIPVTDLLRLANDSDLIDRGLPLPDLAYNLGAPDLGCFESDFVPVPAALLANAGNRSAELSWTPLPGQVRYTIARSREPDGTFVTLAEDLANPAYTDDTVENDVTYFYVVSARSPFGASSAGAPVAVTPVSPLAAWLRQYFPASNDPAVIAPNADPDGDGRPNLLEFFLGTRPDETTLAPATTLHRVGDDWAFSFEMSKTAAGVAFSVESSLDLASWITADDAPTKIEDRGDRWSLRFTVTDLASRPFWRLRVTVEDP